MREIKFRGLDLNSGKWVYGYYDQPWVVSKIYNTDFGFRYVDRETVGQYTGLKDSNGKEIYEGDIIQCGEHQFYAVKYEEGRFACSNDGRIWLKSVAKRGKVVGNIHENPELLEEEK